MNKNVFLIAFLISTTAFAREFVTERPDKARTAYTLDKGRVALEAEFINYTTQAEDKMYTTAVGEMTFRFGITQNSEVQVRFDPYMKESIKKENVREINKGFGNTTLDLKYNLKGNDEGNYALAVVPFVEIPTAGAEIWDDKWEGGLAFVTDIEVLKDKVFAITIAPNNVRKDRDLKWQTSLMTAASLAMPIYSEKLHGYIEIFSENGLNEEQGTIVTYDFALQYDVSESVKFDIGTFIGASPDADDLESFAGASFLF